MDTATLFGREDALDDGGWGKTFAKLDAKKIVQRVVKEKRERIKRAIAEEKARAARYRKWDQKEKREMAEKEKWPVVVAEGKRAEELALALLQTRTGGYGSTKAVIPASLVICGMPYEKKLAAVRHELGGRQRQLHEGPKVGETARGITREATDKKMYEMLLWKDLIEIAERVVQSPQRPEWMESVGNLKRLKKKWAKYLAKENREREKSRRESDANWRKQQAQLRRLERMTPEQRKRHDEREKRKAELARKEYERKHWKEVQASRQREAEWKRNQAIRRANSRWLQNIAASVAKIIRQKAGRAAGLEEIAGFINEALRIRGFSGDYRDVYVSPERNESTGKYTGKFRLWGKDELMPGAKPPVERPEEQEEDEEEDE